MPFTTMALVIALGLFFGMFASLELGRRLGLRFAARRKEEGKSQVAATMEAAVFGLMGLLIAFSFSGATSRFDQRRHLIVEETNAIGTAWLRLDVLPAAAQPELRDMFRAYTDLRVETYAALPDVDAAWRAHARAMAVQSEIWKAAVAACQTPEGQRVAILMLPSLNAMIDITTTRLMAVKTHPPMILYVLLCGLAFGSMVLTGYDHALVRTKSWVHILGFAALMAVTVYIIIDLEFPRLGMIRVDDFDQALRDLRASMG